MKNLKSKLKQVFNHIITKIFKWLERNVFKLIFGVLKQYLGGFCLAFTQNVSVVAFSERIVRLRYILFSRIMISIIILIYLNQINLMNGLKCMKKTGMTWNVWSKLNELKSALKSTMAQFILKSETNIQYSKCRLDAYSPNHTLKRGFGLISSNDIIIRSITSLNEGDTIRVKLHDGIFEAIVKRCRMEWNSKIW